MFYPDSTTWEDAIVAQEARASKWTADAIDTVEVTGSIPVSLTIVIAEKGPFLGSLFIARYFRQVA